MLRRSSFVELFLIFLPGLGFVSGNVSVRCPVESRGFGVSLWSYLAAEVTCGKVFCGYRPQNKAHLSEPGTHQRTWRVMGRPAWQKTQTLSMTRRNDRTRHDHAAAPPAVRPSLPPSHPQKKEPQKRPKNEECPGSGLPGRLL